MSTQTLRAMSIEILIFADILEKNVSQVFKNFNKPWPIYIPFYISYT